MAFEWEDKVWPGWPLPLEINRRVSAYARRKEFRVGITSESGMKDRARRWSGEYDRGILLWSTDDEDDIRSVESDVVEFFKDYADNQTGGGGGRLGQPPYYLYVVLKG